MRNAQLRQGREVMSVAESETSFPARRERCAYLAWCWPGHKGQELVEGNGDADVSGWLSENLVTCQECGLQLSSVLLKKDADGSGTSHQGQLQAKKGVGGRNDSRVIYCIAVRCFPLHLGTNALCTGSLPENIPGRESQAPGCEPALRLPNLF